MKKISILSLSLVMAMGSMFTSCEAVKNTNNTQRGAGIGAAGGAVLGAILGNNLGKGGNGAVGAVLGGVVGGVAGGVIGNKMDKQARQIDEAIPGAEVERVGEGIKLVLNENAVRFDTSKSTLTAAAKANLDKLIPVFQEYAETNITIFGYTDSTGPADFNLKLSGERAASVRNYLISKGLNTGRFTVTGMGIADPIASNETTSGRAENRRVEFAITANEKMLQEAQQEAGQ
ncbi:OmpA family protein [Flavobacterium frigidarium]|jgi:outer membrane protein OmpA-like peptidoglycan-associated protein|uniref:OmpA family protein n=1 Tax=Flavobacterium frigidarium TaxID=99286 RepID=A0ABV4KA96_9FLAO|nr:OmpA family protein [Flavobacterium frigidarium]MBU2061035.1 OmpA family protein [Bacteroidota bacterium]MDG1872225.1 OmpA family protein [Flavobacterium sp.]